MELNFHVGFLNSFKQGAFCWKVSAKWVFCHFGLVLIRIPPPFCFLHINKPNQPPCLAFDSVAFFEYSHVGPHIHIKMFCRTPQVCCICMFLFFVFSFACVLVNFERNLTSCFPTLCYSFIYINFVFFSNLIRTICKLVTQQDVWSYQMNISQKQHTKKVVIIMHMGGTGTGQSILSVHLASRYKAELINSDKMQVYKGPDILSNKVTMEEQCVTVPQVTLLVTMSGPL